MKILNFLYDGIISVIDFLILEAAGGCSLRLYNVQKNLYNIKHSYSSLQNYIISKLINYLIKNISNNNIIKGLKRVKLVKNKYKNKS